MIDLPGLVENVGRRIPGASLAAVHDDHLDVTRLSIGLRIGTTFSVSDEAALRSPIAVESAVRQAVTAIERDALERQFAEAVADSRREAAARLARAEGRIERARQILADYITKPTPGDREVILARLTEVLR